MSDGNANARTIGGGLTVLVIIALPLWFEFREPGQLLWNIALALLMIVLLALAFFGQRYFKAHANEIGEARFDTSNRQADQ